MNRSSEGWIQTRTYTKKNGKISYTYIARITPPGMAEISKSFKKLGRIDEPGTAKHWLDTQREAIRKGTLVDPRSRKWTLGEWCDEWLDSVTVSPRTYENYQVAIKLDVKPSGLAERPLTAITDSELRAWYKALTTNRTWANKNLSPSSALLRRTILASIFLAAVDADILVKTPMRKVKTQRKITQIKPIEVSDIPTREEVWKLHAAASELSDYLTEPILVSAGTGLRPGELFGLTEDHLILDKNGNVREIHVTQQLLLKTPGAVFDLPKTESSVRRIPVGAEVSAAFARHLQAHPLDPTIPNGRVIFRAPTQRPWTSSNFHYHWALIRTASDSRSDMIYYRFRHYYISALIAGGASPKLVMARAGHTSAEYTLRRYARLWPSDDLLTAQLSDFALEREKDGRNSDSSDGEDEGDE